MLKIDTPDAQTAELRASEARLRALMANVPGAIYRCALDADWTMELIGDEIERITGYPSSDFVGNACRTFASVIHPGDRDEVERAVREAVDAGRSFSLEYRVERADGSVCWVLERGALVEDGAGSVWLDGIIFDISERRRAEEALRHREVERARSAELQASRKRIVAAADSARRELERDLHDGAQQQLVALALDLRLIRSALDTDPPKAARLLGGAEERLATALLELRELARGLHPALLTNSGLETALDGLVGRASMPVELRYELDERLSEPVEVAAYFVVSEALANAAKHARASRGVVRVSRAAPGRVVVDVRDDGVGGAQRGRGSGLLGLADRVEALEGALEVHSPRGAGTTVRATLPG